MWSNFPVSDVPRPRLRLGNLTAEQHDAVMRLLQVLLSAKGYRKVVEIMGSDQALADGGTRFAAGVAAYTLAIFGEPSGTTPWMVQFGGHHLALNITIVGGRGVLASVLTGVQPAVYASGSERVRALARARDIAFALLGTLDETQRKQVMLDDDPGLVLGPGHDGEAIKPEGLKASAMNDQQRAMLFALISEWAGMLNEIHAAPRLAELHADLLDTCFAWSGPPTHEPDRNGASYFRVQGSRLMIEFAPQEPGGDRTMHVHTIYRDSMNAYGRAFV